MVTLGLWQGLIAQEHALIERMVETTAARVKSELTEEMGDRVLPLLRDRFNYLAADGTTQQLFRASPVAVAASLGLGVQF